MLSPEIWNFDAPKHQIKHFCSKERNRSIEQHHFNHSVSVVLPNLSSIPESFVQSALEDSCYYKIKDLHIAELVNSEFIESFVKKGELSIFPVDKKIDTEDLAVVLPTGYLLLRLHRDTYQRLGIEGKPSIFERGKPSRYVVAIDLKGENLIPGKKYFNRIYNNLIKLPSLKFDFVVAWESPEENICPSSIAAWFDNNGYDVSLCHQKIIRRTKYSINIPIFDTKNNTEAFYEWLGIFSIDGALANEDPEAQYVSSYNCPSPNLEVGQVHYLQFTGFLTSKRVKRICNLLEEYFKESSLPWFSMDVQGFLDSPISWGMQEHNYYIDGDNSYTIIFHSNGEESVRKSWSSNNKPRIEQ